ncbi:C40 family peptidase [Roseiarcus sp.]|uniref:C40 family peptidase n=1 Tax=Roseiarcus sp. TaxID=1969460 RepID=UPI003F9D9DF6
MSALLDRRLTPVRPDLAAAHLRGLVDAPRFVEGRAMQVTEASAPLRRAPATDAPLETEALYGENVTVYDDGEEGWAWVQLERDGYVGYLPLIDLGPPAKPTHRVAALRTHVYPGPSIKLPPMMALSLGARATITRQERDFAVTADGRYLWARHLADAGSHEPDFVAVAEMFLHAPYLWGGRTSEGIDCSGLVQAGMTAAGVAAPRDSDMLEATLGEPVPLEAPLMRGDLVFWKGHVGVMRDEGTLLHANGWPMAVVSEPFAEARARIAASGGGEVTSVKRLAGL